MTIRERVNILFVQNISEEAFRKLITMSDIPGDAPKTCPGTHSNVAGKASGCEGCPNQVLCASNPKLSDPDLAIIRSRLASVGHIILILSGKGGVGKSTVTYMLAQAIAGVGAKPRVKNMEITDKVQVCSNDFPQVAVLDVDICGPSQPIMMGLKGGEVHQSGDGWSTVFSEENISLMSIGFLLGSDDDAVVWRGPRKNGMIKQFLRDVDWGELDYLLVDTPPGTSDEHLTIIQYLQGCKLDGAILVTTPQDVAIQDVRKELNFCNKVSLRVIGVIENMTEFLCPNCSKLSQIFQSSGGCEKMCSDFGLKLLGRVGLDPRIARACDEGKLFLREHYDSPAAEAYRAMAKDVRTIVDRATSPDD